jgi:DNA-binding NarL/FixJ family response regulator
MVEPSCPALVILDEDAFRIALIKTFDQKHFTVTVCLPESDDAVRCLEDERRAFHVIIVGVDLPKRKGIAALDYLHEHREMIRCGIIIIGEASPEIRTFAPWVDETLLRPVDPEYVAQRARTYCSC